MVDKGELQKTALRYIQADGRRVAPRLVARFGISRQAANNHLRALVEAGLVEAEGKTQGRVYQLACTQQATRTYTRDGLDDYVPWRELFIPIVSTFPENVRDIWGYGVTEMVNNAVEHSEGSSVHVAVKANALFTEGYVSDDGVGIFRKLQRELHLHDPREAFLELQKGKVTTDPDAHSGQGVFFTSRAFDQFAILSGELIYLHNDEPLDLLADRRGSRSGTMVVLQLGNESTRKLRAVFDKYSSPEADSFSRTVVPVRLAELEGQKLVSRSQARRVTVGLDRFHQVVLDFAGVTEIGQAFADEVFRVFAGENPKIALAATRTTRQVAQMIARARSASGMGEERTAERAEER